MPSDTPTTELTAENQRLREELNRLKKDIEDGEKARVRAREETQLKNDTRRTHSTVLGTVIGFLGLGAGLITARSQWQSAQASKTTAEIAMQNLQAEKARLDADRLNIDTNQKRLEIDLKQMGLQKDEANKQRVEAIAAINALKIQISFADADLQGKKRELAAVIPQLEIARQEVRELTDRKREIDAEIIEVRRALGSSAESPATVIAEQRSKLDELEKQESGLSSLIASKDAELAAKQGEIDRLRGEVANRATKPAEIVNQDYAETERKFRKAAEIEPKSFQAQYKHGLALQLLGRTTEAVTAYLRALAIDPTDFNANLNVATAYLQLGELAQAVRFGERAVQIDARSAPARVNLAAIYTALNRHSDAVIEYQQASELTELSGPLLLNMAESYGKAHRNEEMLNTLEQLIKTDPSARAYERLGAAFFQLRRYVDAHGAFKKSLDIDPVYYPALNGLGICLLNQHKFSDKTDDLAKQQGLSALRKSLQIERNQPRIIEILAGYQ